MIALSLREPDALARPAEPVADQLARRNDEYAMGLTHDRLRDWERVERALPSHRGVLAADMHWTLVHGDLHAGNLIQDREGVVRIVVGLRAQHLRPRP